MTALDAGNSHCPNGGVQLTDDAGTSFVCNGSGQSVALTALDAGNSNCPNGGTQLSSGGTTTYACNGSGGSNGTFSGLSTFNGNVTINGNLTVDGGTTLVGTTASNGVSAGLVSVGQLVAPNTWVKLYDSSGSNGAEVTFSQANPVVISVNPGVQPSIYKVFCDGTITPPGGADTRLLVRINRIAATNTYNSQLTFFNQATANDFETSGFEMVRTVFFHKTYMTAEYTIWSNVNASGGGGALNVVGQGMGTALDPLNQQVGTSLASGWINLGGSTLTALSLETNSTTQSFTGHCAVYQQLP